MVGGTVVEEAHETLAARIRPLGNAVRLGLLDLLVKPLYVEEVASKLMMSRPGARKHLDELVELGVVAKRMGKRESGAVVEYLLDRSRLYQLQVEFSELGSEDLPPAPDEAPRTLLADAATESGEAGMMRQAGLTVVRGLDPGHRFTVPVDAETPLRIGRGSEADINLDYDPFVSTRHAQVRLDHNGLHLRDMFSKNGTEVNWQRLKEGDEVSLRRGDVVGVGKTLFVVQGPSGIP
ncbi:MAG: FHA domain-containing protein [Thermoplasmatota archaeon]